MADTLVERLAGQTRAGEVPVEVLGYGPIPAPLARDWITETADTDLDSETQAWIRGHPDGTIVTSTPTGRTYASHTYASHPPPPIGRVRQRRHP